MSEYLEKYWILRLKACAQALEKNNFEASVAETTAEACWQVLDLVGATLADGQSIGFGGSQTIMASGVYAGLKSCKHLNILDHFDPELSREESMARRTQAARAELYITGSNAITETGTLVNLDSVGNRVGSLTYGPRKVIVLAGRNKLVPDLEAAMRRIKTVAAPANAMRLKIQTPCAVTGRCSNCRSQERICNTWTIHENCSPAKRIKVILINEDLGL